MVIISLGITLSFSTLVFGEFLDFDKYFNYIFWPIYLCFIYVDFYVTKLTFKVENRKKYSSGFADKVGRFIVLSTLIKAQFVSEFDIKLSKCNPSYRVGGTFPHFNSTILSPMMNRGFVL